MFGHVRCVLAEPHRLGKHEAALDLGLRCSLQHRAPKVRHAVVAPKQLTAIREAGRAEHSSELDAGLRVRGKAGPEQISEPIGPVTATPVCSPALAKRIRSPRDLLRQTLIEMRGVEGSWATYPRTRGVEADSLRTLSFEGYYETLAAAERGFGVSFGLFPMTSEWVRRERLAVPLTSRTEAEGGVHLVYRSNDPRHALLSEVAAWIREQYAALPALPSGRVLLSARRRQARAR